MVKNKKIWLYFSMIFSLTVACGGMPEKSEDRASYYLDMAVDYHDKNNLDESCKALAFSLDLPTGAIKTKQQFHQKPELKNGFKNCLLNNISNAHDMSDVVSENKYHPGVYDVIRNVENQSVLEPNEINQIKEFLIKNLTEKSLQGSLLIDLSYDRELVNLMSTSQNKNLLLDRTIEKIRKNSNRESQVQGLINYISTNKNDSSELRKIEKLLPTLHLKISEVDRLSAFFPDFARDSKETIMAPVSVRIKNVDRLFHDDVTNRLKEKARKVNWSDEFNEKNIIIEIEQVRNIEKAFPEKTETISYGKNELGSLSAIFLMPDKSSYIYEEVKDGGEIEYGYVVTEIKNNSKLYDKVIRGKVSISNVSCNNLRIQNVFGGSSPANFYATEDMKSRCENKTKLSMDDLRKDVLDKIVDGVFEVPDIKAMVD